MLLPLAFSLLLAPAAPAPPPSLREAVEAAVRVGRVPPDLYILAGRGDSEGAPYRSLEVWGDGAGIQDGQRMFRLPPPKVVKMLGDLLEARLFEMSEAPGQEDRPGQTALALRARVLVRAGGARKDVYRTMRGERSPALEALAARLFAACASAAASGITASSIDDALGKLRSGRLAPQALKLTFQSLDEKADAAGVRAGWVLSIEGNDAEVRTSSPGTGAGSVVSRRLSGAELRAVVDTLRKGRVYDAGPALFSTRYEELALSALGHEKTIQARRFAGLDERTHERAQKAWNALRDVLERITSATVTKR